MQIYTNKNLFNLKTKYGGAVFHCFRYFFQVQEININVIYANF